MNKEYLFSSESVSEGHPDKIADQISDAVLDTYLSEDKNAKVACETLISEKLLVISGEFKTEKKFKPDFEEIAFNVIRNIGYGNGNFGFNFDECEVITSIKSQSSDINRGVERGEEIGAGDQGLMFGYASNETTEYMPLPILLAHKLMKKQSDLRKSGEIEWLGPDAKTQVTVRYKNDKPVTVEKIVFSTQHTEGIKLPELKEVVKNRIIKIVIPENLLCNDTEFLINPTGSFIEGGPKADTGLTGRKIIVDTYGGSCPHGGGAFSGKDPTKVDRSAAYMARFAAKNVVAKGFADRCTIQVSYAIGITKPLSLMVNTHGTNKVDDSKIEKYINDNFDFTPSGIINRLNLLRPIYLKTAAYGHFGRETEDFEWEKII